MVSQPTAGPVSINGNSLWVKVAGTGPPLVVQCAGWGSGCAYLEETLTPLEKICTVYYVDTRGSGRSETPNDPTQLSVGHIIWDLETLVEINRLDRFILLGHSHGAFIAMNYALRHPSQIAGLILISPQLGTREVASDLRRGLPRLARDPRYSQAASRWTMGRVARTDESLARWFREVFELYFADPQIGRSWWSRLHLETISIAAWRNITASNPLYEVRQKLSELNTSTLILVGRHDFITSPAQSYLIKRSHRAAELHIFERSGHFPWLEEPELVFRTMASFIEKQ